VLRAVYGTCDSAALEAHLAEKIGHDYEILMVHSSVNNMKPMYTEGALDFVRMLIRFCGPNRTLAMPAFFFGDPAIGGAYDTFKQRPRFDMRRTPSQTGLATELFRRMKGVKQSRHPVYRVAALGPLAEPLTAGHETAPAPTGAGTPFDFMVRHDTMIVGIGKPFEVLTQVHHAEDILGDRFPVPRNPERPLEMTVIDGDESVPVRLAGRGFAWRREMSRLRAIMDRDTLREWRFHHIPLFATRAADVTRSLVDAAERGVTIYSPGAVSR
jgi:aminoglycoside N3'-acetyltransferase